MYYSWSCRRNLFAFVDGSCVAGVESFHTPAGPSSVCTFSFEQELLGGSGSISSLALIQELLGGSGSIPSLALMWELSGGSSSVSTFSWELYYVVGRLRLCLNIFLGVVVVGKHWLHLNLRRGEGWSRGLSRCRRESLCLVLPIPIQNSIRLLLTLIGRFSSLLLGWKGYIIRNQQSKGENSLPVLGVSSLLNNS